MPPPLSYGENQFEIGSELKSIAIVLDEAHNALGGNLGALVEGDHRSLFG